MKIGILALQGNVQEHQLALQKLGVNPVLVKNSIELADLDGLVIPGGESTTISKLLDANRLREDLEKYISAHKPIFATCAGLVLLAEQVTPIASGVKMLGGLDISVQRNAFGRQKNSFITDVDLPSLNIYNFPAFFIRAPLVEEVGEQVEILAKIEQTQIVAVRNANVLALSFHPELSNDLRLHRYFMEKMVV